MSTTLSVPVQSNTISSSSVKGLPFLKVQAPSYTPWREPMSERQTNMIFTQQILPGLSALLEDSFQDLSDFNREEAVQDAVCQALEAWRVLRLYETCCTNSNTDETSRVLAKFASSQYLTGARFATPRSTSRL